MFEKTQGGRIILSKETSDNLNCLSEATLLPEKQIVNMFIRDINNKWVGHPESVTESWKSTPLQDNISVTRETLSQAYSNLVVLYSRGEMECDVEDIKKSLVTVQQNLHLLFYINEE